MHNVIFSYFTVSIFYHANFKFDDGDLHRIVIIPTNVKQMMLKKTEEENTYSARM